MDKEDGVYTYTHRHTHTHTHMLEYYSAIKKNEILAAVWMDLKNIMLSEISQRKQILYDLTYIYDPKHNTDKCIYQNRNRLTDSENKQQSSVRRGK